MKRRTPFRLEHTESANPVLPLVEILGDGRVLIERHKGVLGYNKQHICVKLSFGMLVVSGCNLEIVHMSKVRLVIIGRVFEIVFKRGND